MVVLQYLIRNNQFKDMRWVGTFRVYVVVYVSEFDFDGGIQKIYVI